MLLHGIGGNGGNLIACVRWLQITSPTCMIESLKNGLCIVVSYLIIWMRRTLKLLRAGAILAALMFTEDFAAAEEGVTDDTVLVGQTAGVTGVVSGQVKELNDGASAYFRIINKGGGVNGRKIKMITLDDMNDPAMALKNAESLISKEHIFSFFQVRGTPHTQNIVPLLERNKITLLAPITGAMAFHQPVNPWIFNVRAKYRDEIGRAVAQFKSVGVERVGLLHADDAFGLDGLGGFNSAMSDQQLVPSGITKVSRDYPNYGAAAVSALEGNPQAIIIVSSPATAVKVIKIIRKSAVALQIMTLSNNSSESFIKELGGDGVGVIVSQIAPTPDLNNTPLSKEFNAAAKLAGIAPSYSAMEGFMNAKVLVEALQRAGRKLTRQGFIEALESMRHFDLGGNFINFSKDDHGGGKFVDLTIIGRHGKFIH